MGHLVTQACGGNACFLMAFVKFIRRFGEQKGVPKLLVTIALAFYLPAALVLGQGHQKIASVLQVGFQQVEKRVNMA